MMVRHHWRDLGLFDKGFEAGSVACLSNSADSLAGWRTSCSFPLFARKPYGPVKDGIEEAIAAHEWEMWDSGGVMGALRRLGRDLDHLLTVSAEDIVRIVDRRGRKGLAGRCSVDLEETEATDEVGEGNEE
jgi:hypothetical protein